MDKFETKPYLDAEKDLFNKLSIEDQQQRVKEWGSQEVAISQYGQELALKSADKDLTDLSVEDQEQFEKLKQGAENVIKCFQLKRSKDNKKGENLLIVTDSGADKLMLLALMQAGRKVAGADCRVVVAPETKHAAQSFGPVIGEKMKTADAVLLITSLSRSHSKETAELVHPHHSADVIGSLLDSPALKDAFPKLRAKYTALQIAKLMDERKLDKEAPFPGRSRFVSITNTTREILTEGAALEDPAEMVERIDKFVEAMKGIERVRLTSENGTDLELDLKVPTFFKEDGIIDSPGKASNFPTGEYAGAVDLENTNGTIVIDGAVGMIGRLKEPIKITIAKGVAVKIEGGKEAQKLQEILEQADAEYRKNNPADKTTSAFRLAEFAFGMNSKAFRYDEQGKRISPPTSLEGEKGLGTIHIALGKNSLFSVDKQDPDYNNIPIHIDCVAMNTTIAGEKDDGTKVDLVKDGEIVCL